MTEVLEVREFHYTLEFCESAVLNVQVGFVHDLIHLGDLFFQFLEILRLILVVEAGKDSVEVVFFVVGIRERVGVDSDWGVEMRAIFGVGRKGNSSHSGH